jgi:hypothetical protein
MRLKTEIAQKEEISGMFTLILYSKSVPRQIANVAFLDREDDIITFEPFAPSFDFKTINGLLAEEALARADAFVSNNNLFQRSQLSKILDEYDRVVGYEIRPLYNQVASGVANILNIDYRLNANKVVISINLDPNIERLLNA